MTKKEKLIEFFNRDHDIHTRFTINFIASFTLQLQYLDKPLTPQLITEWQTVVGDILEVFAPSYTKDVAFFNNLCVVLGSLEDTK